LLSDKPMSTPNAARFVACGLGLEAQRDAIAAFAKAEGFAITRCGSGA
jgi:hypothetical protein